MRLDEKGEGIKKQPKKYSGTDNNKVITTGKGGEGR